MLYVGVAYVRISTRLYCVSRLETRIADMHYLLYLRTEVLVSCEKRHNVELSTRVVYSIQTAHRWRIFTKCRQQIFSFILKIPGTTLTTILTNRLQAPSLDVNRYVDEASQFHTLDIVFCKSPSDYNR